MLDNLRDSFNDMVSKDKYESKQERLSNQKFYNSRSTKGLKTNKSNIKSSVEFAYGGKDFQSNKPNFRNKEELMQPLLLE